MKLKDAIEHIVISTCFPVTPQEIRDKIKREYPDLYGTQSQLRNVKKGHYKNIDHALLVEIYLHIKNAGIYNFDRTFKPMKVSLINESISSPESLRPVPKSARRTSNSFKSINYDDKVKKVLLNTENIINLSTRLRRFAAQVSIFICAHSKHGKHPYQYLT